MWKNEWQTINNRYKVNCEKVKYWLATVTEGLAVHKAETCHATLCKSREDVHVFNTDIILMGWIHPIGNKPVRNFIVMHPVDMSVWTKAAASKDKMW